MRIEDLFIKSKGQPVEYKGKTIKMVDKVLLPAKKLSFKLHFISTDSKLKQGVVLQTKGEFHINEQKIPNKIILWENTAPRVVEAIIKSIDKVLIIYNVWETKDGVTHYWHNGGAFYTEAINNAIIYHCNDGEPDDDFNDLVFSLDILEV